MIGVGNIRPSINEFKVFYNEQTRPIRPELQIRNVEVYDHHMYPRFFIPLTKTAAIFGCTHNTDGSIQQIAIVRENDGTAKSRFEFILSVTLMMESLKPKMGLKQKSKILEGLQFFNKKIDIYNSQVFSKFEDIHLMLLSSKMAGFFSFSITYR